jgi:hypothetical protein
MESGTTAWVAVMNRLERLEKQNRRFKQIGTVGLVISALVLFLVSQRRTIEASEFVLKDSQRLCSIRTARFSGRLLSLRVANAAEVTGVLPAEAPRAAAF